MTEQFFPDGNGLFSRMTQDSFGEYENDVTHMAWCSPSPVLDPTEHLWKADMFAGALGHLF